MTSAKPTIIIVPGSFSPVSLYNNLISQLSSHGYPALAVSLPSVGRRPNAPPATLAEDAAQIHSVAAQLADAGKDIILAAHSYGGLPGTESVRDLSKIDREAKGQKGGIIRLVYFAAFVPEEGQALRDITGPTPDFVKIDDGYMVMDEQLRVLYAPYVFSDMLPEEGLELMGKMEEHSSVSFDGKLSYPAYKYVPVTYLFCEEDKVIPPELQRSMVEKARSQSAMGFQVFSCNAGHGVNVSMPDAIVKAIEEFFETMEQEFILFPQDQKDPIRRIFLDSTEEKSELEFDKPSEYLVNFVMKSMKKENLTLSLP